ncbi:D-alanine--D-alanine ligase [Marinomonas sp. 2405UD68-3]|uniref:D-alanine--D-alanine ligase n=1 Tax=Marinomonas sp. 2405UD68-3 TaxID=3391835 RepID=UPI0039C97EE8
MNIRKVPLPQGINEGMPPLELTEKPVSFFEFWPAWAMYAPVIIQCVGLSIKYRSIGLPLISNPKIPLSGMVGESKADILDQPKKEVRSFLCEYVTSTKKENLTSKESTKLLLDQYFDKGLSLPAVAKPDLGCRGVGVRLIENEQELSDYIELFPENARFLLQEKSKYQAEAGIFYIRYPGERKGKITSITLKYTPWVVGDGVQTLKELILADPRAGLLSHIYLPRHKENHDKVIPEGEAVRIAFAGSHSGGSIFRDGNRYITEALTQSLDTFFDGMPEFHFGRLDVKFKHIDELMDGKNFQILEINGASSEATHIWDSKTKFPDAIKALLFQYRTLFEIGHLNRKAGYQTPSLLSLYRAWREEKSWVVDYPSMD